MKLSDAIRKHLALWEQIEALNGDLEKRGLTIEAKPVLDPDTGSVKFENARVIIDVKKAIPKLADLFIENGLPMPIDLSEPFGEADHFDPLEQDDELSTMLGFDPSSASDVDRFIDRASGRNKGFDVVSPQPDFYVRKG